MVAAILLAAEWLGVASVGAAVFLVVVQGDLGWCLHGAAAACAAIAARAWAFERAVCEERELRLGVIVSCSGAGLPQTGQDGHAR